MQALKQARALRSCRRLPSAPTGRDRAQQPNVQALTTAAFIHAAPSLPASFYTLESNMVEWNKQEPGRVEEKWKRNRGLNNPSAG